MIDFLKMKLPLIFSAYAAALFIFFAFIYAPNIEYFVWANLLLFSAWSAYTWVIVWRQSRLIENMLETMEDTRATIHKIIDEAMAEAEAEDARLLEEVRREAAEKKKRKPRTRKTD